MPAQTPLSIQTVCRQTSRELLYCYVHMSTSGKILVVRAAQVFGAYSRQSNFHHLLAVGYEQLLGAPVFVSIVWLCPTLMSNESNLSNLWIFICYIIRQQGPGLARVHSDTFAAHTNTHINKGPELLVKTGRWLTDWVDWALEAFW